MSITLWDIPSTQGPFSPNTWKIRYCLNFKRIPYKTQWIEYPDIAGHCQKLGIAHTSTKRDGTLYYSLPAIYDPSTKFYLADSGKIVEYLEKQYLDTPSVFPDHTIGLAIDFESALDAKLGALWKFVIPAMYNNLNPASQEFYRTTREKTYNKKLEDVPPKDWEAVEEWAKVKDGFEGMAIWYSETSDTGPFLLGDRVSWADFVVGAHLMWFEKAWGESDGKWKAILSWQGGVWKTLSDALKEYEMVD